MNLPAVIQSGLPAAIAPLIDWQTTSVFSADGQYDGSMLIGASIKRGATIEDLRMALAAVEKALQPCGSGARAIEALRPMYATRRNRPGEQTDEEASLAVYAARFREYPVEIIRQAGAHFIDTTPWMPAVSEMLPVLDRFMRPLRALKEALEVAIARATAPRRPQIVAPQPPKTQRDAIAQLLALRRQAGDTEYAAILESKLANIEKRSIEDWAVKSLAAKKAKEDAARAEYQRVADEAKAVAAPTPKTEQQIELERLAAERRQKLFSGGEAA